MISRTKQLVLGVIRYNLYSEIQNASNLRVKLANKHDISKGVREMYMSEANAIDILFDMLENISDEHPVIDYSDLDYVDLIAKDADIEALKGKLLEYVDLCKKANAETEKTEKKTETKKARKTRALEPISTSDYPEPVLVCSSEITA